MIIVCSQSILFLPVLFAVFTSVTALMAGSGSITVLSGCDDTHYRLNITTVSRPAWRGLQGVTAYTHEHTHTETHTHTDNQHSIFCTISHDCGNKLKNSLWKCLQMEMQAEMTHTHTHTHTHTPQLTLNLAWTHTCPASFHFTDHQNFSALDVQIQISHTWKHPKTNSRWRLNVEFSKKQGGTSKIN